MKCWKQNRMLAFLFCVAVHFFWLVNVCFCCVRFCFFPYQAKRLAPKWPVLCRMGRKTLTSNQCFMVLCMLYSCSNGPGQFWNCASYEVTKPGCSSSVCLFCVILMVSYNLLLNVCLYCVRFNFFVTIISDWLERTFMKLSIFMSSGM